MKTKLALLLLAALALAGCSAAQETAITADINKVSTTIAASGNDALQVIPTVTTVLTDTVKVATGVATATAGNTTTTTTVVVTPAPVAPVAAPASGNTSSP